MIGDGKDEAKVRWMHRDREILGIHMRGRVKGMEVMWEGAF